jgi:SAM-dependent methyltransferase
MTLNDANNYDRWAKYYDLSMGDRNPFIDFYARLLKADMRSVIDFGCGSGVITDALAQRLRVLSGSDDLRFVGVDMSLEMLNRARKRNARIEWRQGDVRNYRAGSGFDLAISCYNTLQHLDGEGLLQAFEAIRSCLRPGAIFAFDIYQPNLSYLAISQRDRLARTLIDEAGQLLEIREDSKYDFPSCVLHLTWRLVRAGGKCGAEPLAEIHYEMWQHFPKEVLASLEKTGFEVRARYGDLNQAVFTSSSKKQVMVCTLRS